MKNIKDRDELKQGFAKIFAEKDLTQLEYTIKEVNNFAKGQEQFNKKDRKLLNEILDKDDRIVHVKVKREGIAIAVRIRDGKAKVAGFRD